MQVPIWLQNVMAWDAENLNALPTSAELISNNGISLVWRARDAIYKRSIPYFTRNELWCLQQLYDSGFVPLAKHYDKYTIKMQDLGETQPVTDVDKFMSYRQPLKSALMEAQIRHGDITKAAIVVRDNVPYLIDFAEARLWHDPRPNKRKWVDEYWIDKTFEELCDG